MSEPIKKRKGCKRTFGLVSKIKLSRKKWLKQGRLKDPPPEDKVVANVDDDVDDDENDIGTFTEFMEENVMPLHLDDARRLAISYAFNNGFNAEPDTKLWSGTKGIRTQIKNFLNINENTKIDYIFHDTIECKQKGVPYLGKRKDNGRTGRPTIIESSSYEAQIIADCIESGSSVTHTWWVVNQFRKENQLPSLTLAPVKSCIKRLKPQIKKLKKRQQGNYDEHSAWAKARYNWNTQLFIRFGYLKGTELEKLKVDRVLPKWFDPNQMTHLKADQVVWWDETHKKCTIGGQGSKNDFYVRFPRDENGKLDLINGTYDETPITILNVKYDKEVRLCLGCAIVKDSEDVEVGKMAKHFDYSGKCIKSIKEYKRLKRELRTRIRNSKDTVRWTTSTRIVDTIYHEDDVTLLANIAQKTKEKLQHHNVSRVGDLKTMTEEQMDIIDNGDKLFRIPKSTLIRFKGNAKTALPGGAPPMIDHRLLADNPWLSKYGDGWEEEERNSPSIAQYCCITDLIEHIIKESAELYKGTEYEDNWVFYHDALSLMTSKATIKWMKEKDYYKRWILPVNDLHKDDETLTKYEDRPVGNSPENMPLDTSLNHDIHEAVIRHVNLTWELSDDSPTKFCMSTPKRGVRAYERLMTAVPSGKRIIDDITNVFKSLELVRQAKGCLVDELQENYGVRWESNQGGGGKEHGGKRTRLLAEDDYDGGAGKWIHDDAAQGVDAKMVASKLRAAGGAGAKQIKDKLTIR